MLRAQPAAPAVGRLGGYSIRSAEAEGGWPGATLRHLQRCSVSLCVRLEDLPLWMPADDKAFRLHVLSHNHGLQTALSSLDNFVLMLR
jgi:hypothetical protein